MRWKHWILLGIMATAACQKEPDSTLPGQGTDPAVNEKLNEMEKKLTSVSETTDYYNESFSLTHQSMREVKAYLELLYSNINATRAEHLPEWEEMFRALTDQAAIETEMAIGRPGRMTNFHRQHLRINDNEASVNQSHLRLDEKDTEVDTLAATAEIHRQHLATIDQNLKDFNVLLEQKMAQMDQVLAEYDGRIVAAENRLNTMQQTLDGFAGSFDRLQQKIINMERMLSRYDLATMDRRINDLARENSDQEVKIADLDGRVNINTAGIQDLENDILAADQEISGNATAIGVARADILGILERLDACQCFTHH